MPSSRGSSQPRDQTQVSHIADRFFTNWATSQGFRAICKVCIKHSIQRPLNVRLECTIQRWTTFASINPWTLTFNSLTRYTKPLLPTLSEVPTRFRKELQSVAIHNLTRTFLNIFFFKEYFIWLCQVLVAACGIFVVVCGVWFPDQGSNPDLPHWEQSLNCYTIKEDPQGLDWMFKGVPLIYNYTAVIRQARQPPSRWTSQLHPKETTRMSPKLSCRWSRNGSAGGQCLGVDRSKSCSKLDCTLKECMQRPLYWMLYTDFTKTNCTKPSSSRT